MSERSERNPGITSPLIPAPALSRGKRDTFKVQFIAPLQGAEIFSNPIQRWRDLRSLTPGYYLQPLRGWFSSANLTPEDAPARIKSTIGNNFTLPP